MVKIYCRTLVLWYSSAPRLHSLGRIRHVFKVRPAIVPDASRMCSGCVLHPAKRVWHSLTSCCSFIEVLHLHGRISCIFQTHLVCVPETSHARPRCILHAFQMCLAHISDVSCTHFRHKRTLPWSGAVPQAITLVSLL